MTKPMLSLGLIFSLVILITFSFFQAGISQGPNPAKAPLLTKPTTKFACEVIEINNFDCHRSDTRVDGYIEDATSEDVHSVYTEEASFVAGVKGMALNIDPYLGQYFDIPKETAANLNQFSLSFWATEHADHPEYSHIISFADPATEKGWVFDYQKTGKNFNGVRFSVFNTQGDRFSPPPVPLLQGKFTNIIGTFDGKTVSIYKNGTLYGSVDFIGKYDGLPQVHLKIGEAAYSTEYHWGGTLDDLWIFKKALNAQEVTDFYSGKRILTESLAGHWAFDGNLFDSSDNSNEIIHRVHG